MFLLGCLVSRGIVFKINPIDMCHHEELGIGCINVQVTKVLVGWQRLPYPNGEALLICESMASWVIWDLSNVSKRILATLGERQPDPVELPRETFSKDLIVRSNWFGEEVQLLDEHRVTIVASGVLTLPSEQGIVNGEVLGLDNARVAVVTIHEPSFFPNLSPSVVALVKWPIMSIFLVITKRFIGDIVQEVVENPMSKGYLGIEDDQNSLPQTRPYNYIKCIKFNSEARQRNHLQSKAVSKLTETTIDAIRRQECCKAKCCLHMPREDLESIPLQFHGMSSENKTTHILNLFHCRDQEVKKNACFIVAGHIVCKQAFSTIHGFRTTKYYQYKSKYDIGCIVDVHGNKGLHKPRSNTLHAQALLHAFLVSTREPMPHILYTRSNGTDTIEYCLPSCYTKPQIFTKIRTQMEVDGYNTISELTLYRI